MRRLLALTNVLVLACLVLLTAVRFVDTSLRWQILLASFSAYSILGFVAVLVLSAFLVPRAADRRWVVPVAVIAALGLVVQAWSLAPLVTGGSAGKPDLTVMTSNLEFGRGDAVRVVRIVADQDVDVLVLQEVTPTAYDALLAVGLVGLLPNQLGEPVAGAPGTLVFSRYALESRTSFRLGNGGLDVRVAAPEPFQLLAVHTAQPLRRSEPWAADMVAVRERAAATVEEGPTVVAGDFNATRDHEPLRAILATGLRDAAEQAGSGWQPTWPTRYRISWLQPLIAIDHVLTSEQYVATRTQTFEVPNTDHLAMVAQLRLSKSD